MKKVIWFFLSFSCLYGQTSLAESISDKLIIAIVDKNLPTVLYKHTDKPWNMGTYSLSINKLGAARFSSTETHLNLSLPIEVIVNGKIKQNLLGAAITIGCDSKIVTDGHLEIEPQLNSAGSKAKVSIFIPIPDANLNCDGLKVPIRPLLEQLVLDNKRDWEKDLESGISELFQQVGI